MRSANRERRAEGTKSGPPQKADPTRASRTLRGWRRLVSGLANAESFFASVTQAEEGDRGDREEAKLDEEFAAVGPIHGSIFQSRIGEEAVPEKRGGSEINGEVKRFPKTTAETDAHVGGDGHEGQEIKSDGADGVVEGLRRRMDW